MAPKVIRKTIQDHEFLSTKISANFRSQAEYCDAIIEVEGTEFYGCRGVLGSVSPYFHCMFQKSQMKEGFKKKVSLSGVSKVGFAAVWDYIHDTGFTIEGEEDAAIVLRDAHRLQVDRLCDIVCGELIELLNPENAFRILATAESMAREDLRDGVVTYIARTFSEVIQTDEFLNLSFKTLKLFLEKDEVKVSSEQEVYEATRRWIDHDEIRKEFLPELMERVRLPLLPLKYLGANLLRDPLMYDDPKCLRLVMEAKDFHLPELRDTVPPEKTKARRVIPKDLWCLGMKNNEKKMFRLTPRKWKWELEDVAVWPFRDGGTLAAVERKLFVTDGTELRIFDPYADEAIWEDGPQVPQSYQKKWAAAVSMPDSGSFVVCGCQKSVVRFALGSSQWLHLCDMQHGADGAAAAYQDSCLHIIGGFQDRFHTYLSADDILDHINKHANYGPIFHETSHCMTVLKTHQRLDLRTNKCEELKEIPEARTHSAATFHDGALYVSGGDGATDSYVYDAPGNAWRTLAPMKESRQRHALVSLGNKLYAIGGTGNPSIEEFDGSEWKMCERLDMQSCERACKFSL